MEVLFIPTSFLTKRLLDMVEDSHISDYYLPTLSFRALQSECEHTMNGSVFGCSMTHLCTGQPRAPETETELAPAALPQI